MKKGARIGFGIVNLGADSTALLYVSILAVTIGIATLLTARPWIQRVSQRISQKVHRE